MSWLPAWILALTFPLAGCGGLADDSDGSSVSIAGGEAVRCGDPVSQSAVALVSAGLWDPRGYLPFCSGTLIAKDLVVTAAHCLDLPLEKGTQQVLVKMIDLSGGPARASPAPSVIIPGEARPHEFFGQATTPEYAYDLALVRLAQPAPSYMRPVPIADPARVAIGQKVVLAGYGLVLPRGSRNTQHNSGVLYKVSTKISRVFSLESSDERGLDPNKDKFVGVIEFRSPDGRSGGCRGDSGGPMFAEGSGGLELLGATVGGPGICSSSGFYTNLTLFKSWIEQTKRRF